MYSKTITFKDFNGNEQTETLEFNLSESDMLDLFDLRDAFNEWIRIGQEEQRELTEEEIRKSIWVMKELIRRSYGIRSDDGRRFVKSDGIHEDFTQTAAYNAFFFGLFLNNGAGGIEFFENVFPDVSKLNELAGDTVELPQPETDSKPWITENREPTTLEMRRMSKDDMLEVYARRNRATNN